jgi:hypothetical protein
MNTENLHLTAEKIREYNDLIAKYPGRDYPLESKEGNALQDILFSLMDIDETALSQGLLAQKHALETRLIEEKLRGFA